MIQKVRDKLQMNKKGFTLIELLVVVAIIAILAAIAIPQYSKYRMRARNSAAISDLKTIQTSAEAAYADDITYGTSSGTSTSTSCVYSDNVTVDNDTVNLSNKTQACYGTGTSGAPGTTYVASTYNEGGTKGYATGSGVSIIRYTKCTTPPCGAPKPTFDTAFTFDDNGTVTGGDGTL